jgi:uncharacterized protein with HEPN domain
LKHPERAEDYLAHIAEGIARAMDYVRDMADFVAFEKDRRTQDAVIRNIEVVGEAVSKIQRVSPEFIASHPDLPWARMRAMRNVAIHEYFFVDLQVVWKTATEDLPELKRRIEALQAARGQA